MQPPVFEFEYNLDKQKLLDDYNKKARLNVGYRYLAGKNYEDRIDDESKAEFSRTTVMPIRKGYAYNVAKKLVNDIAGDREFMCHYLAFTNDDLVEWHIDKRPKDYCINASRINIFLTGKSYTSFRDKNWWYECAVVDVMGREHRYEHDGDDQRVMFQIGIKGISHDELCKKLFQRKTIEWLQY